MKLSRILQFLAGVAIAAAGLWIFFRDVDVHSLTTELMRGNIFAYLGCMALTMVLLWLRAIRWQILLPSIPAAHKRGLYSNILVGFMVNNILPARLGEAARVVLLWRKNGYSPALSIGSLILERGIDLIAFMTFFFVPVFALWGTSRFFIAAAVVAAGCAAAVLGFACYALWPKPFKAVVIRILAWLPARLREKLEKMADEVFSNLDWVFNPWRCLWVAVLSYAIIGCYAVIICLLALPSGGLSVLKSAFVVAAAALGAAIPLSPGYVGTLHAVMLQGLTAVGMNVEQARALAILYHALGYIPVTIAGLILFFKMDLSFRDIGKTAEEMESTEKK